MKRTKPLRDFAHDHCLTHDIARPWLALLTAPYSRCAICGVPVYWLRMQGMWMRGGRRGNQRLTLDHITPGDMAGPLRPLCFSCNACRGAAVLTDEEVLRKVRRWYRDPRRPWALRHLSWLNSKPGYGGRGHRSEWTQRRDQRLAIEPLDPQTPPS